jgi:uncharacterized protein (TIGR02145 family)
MKKELSALLFLALAAYGQQEKVAIINTVDNHDSIGFSDLTYLTNRLRETAANILPKSRYGIMTTESIVAFLGSQENAAKECREATCLASLGRKVNADYVAQGRIGRFGKQLSINFEIYNSKSGIMLGSFTGDSKSLQGLLTIIDEKAPALFKEMLGGSSAEINESKENVNLKGKIDNTSKDGKFFTDSRDGKKYKTVIIGKQIWMAENLNYETESSKCYGNEPANCKKYGRLYDWETGMEICPKGWHLPSDKEWQTLVDFAGGDNIAGKKLKAKSGWNSYMEKPGNGRDEFGFAAMPGGEGYDGGYAGYSGVGEKGNWLIADDGNGTYTYGWSMSSEGERVHGFSVNSMRNLLSVRCVKD